jgi:hypothetical protein
MITAVFANIFYQIVRTSKMEIAMMLGSTSIWSYPTNTGVSFNFIRLSLETEGSYDLHKSHLDDYWPMSLIGTLIEFAAYILLAHPSVFTLVVCVKSFALSIIWMGQTKEGVFVSYCTTRLM